MRVPVTDVNYFSPGILIVADQPDPDRRKGAEEDEDKDSIRGGHRGAGEAGAGRGLRNCRDWREVRGGTD